VSAAPLEQRLTALGAALQTPPEPDLAPAVLARVEALGRPRRQRIIAPPRRTLALAFALVLLLAGAAMAVTPIRHAVLDLFDLRGAKVERVPRLPPVPPAAPLNLGRAIPVADARHAASFRALLPAKPPDAAYLANLPLGGRISFRVGRLLVIEFVGRPSPFLVKEVGPGTRLRRVTVNGGRGTFISGAPHLIIFTDEQGRTQPDDIRLAGDVLLWQQGKLIVRIEGARSLAQALALAKTLR
jgi:hypothetical protein